MIDICKLKAAWVAKGLIQSDVAELIDMKPRTFSRRLKRGVLGSDEIEKLISVLEINDPMPIFFAQSVTCKDTRTLRG